MTTFCGDSIQSGGLQKTYEAHMESDLKKTYSQKPTASFFFAARSFD